MNDKTLEMTMLFDFFGDLLTEKQRTYFDLYYNDDLSLAEIAEQTDISRQGVRDVISRAENLLREYENKTGIVSRFMQMQADIAVVENAVDHLLNISDGDIKATAEDVKLKLQNLKG